jgi:hypothetical protein
MMMLQTKNPRSTPAATETEKILGMPKNFFFVFFSKNEKNSILFSFQRTSFFFARTPASLQQAEPLAQGGWQSRTLQQKSSFPCRKPISTEFSPSKADIDGKLKIEKKNQE